MRIKRVESESCIDFEIHEGAVWEKTGRPRETLKVTIFKPSPWNQGDPVGVNWPSTTDRRPELARALARALRRAADEADRINAAAAQEEGR